MSRNDETLSDGGQVTDEQLFGQLSESQSVDLTNRERITRLVDAYIVAPGRVAWNDWRTRIGMVIMSVFVFAAIVGPYLVTRPSSNQGPNNLQPFDGGIAALWEEGGWIDLGFSHQLSVGAVSIPGINIRFPLGTDNYGTPIGRNLVHATPDMLEMVIAGAVVSVGIAAIIGITAGYEGGKIDSFLMYITDIVMTMPSLPLIIVIAAVYAPRQAWIVGVILSIDSWPGLARALRSQVLTLREESYVEASRTMGLSSRTILFRDVTPKLMPYILINAAEAGRRVIFASVALYFLGVLPFTAANWGIMMDTAYSEAYALVNLSNFYQLFWPMLAISILSFGLILFAQGMDRVFNPRLRARHSKKVGADEEEALEG